MEKGLLVMIDNGTNGLYYYFLECLFDIFCCTDLVKKILRNNMLICNEVTWHILRFIKQTNMQIKLVWGKKSILLVKISKENMTLLANLSCTAHYAIM